MLFLLLVLLTSNSIKAQNFTIIGKLQNSSNNLPIEQANVYFQGSSYKTTSLNEGKFTFENIPEGRYSLTVSYPDYDFYEKVIMVDKNMDLGKLLLNPSTAGGTAGALQKSIRSTNIINLLNERPNMANGHSTIFGIAPEPTKIIGDSYLDPKWNIATLLLYRNQQLLEGYNVRYNVTANIFETIQPEGKSIIQIQGSKIQNLVWIDSTFSVPRYFVNGMDFLEDNVPISGFFEVLVDGELPLMRRTKVIIKESNYNEALMVGNRDHELIKRDVYYYLKGRNLTEIPTKRKSFYELFGKDGEAIKDYVESNEFSLKDTNSLFQIFTHYNSKFCDLESIRDQLIN
jgi:hypothetical protein